MNLKISDKDLKLILVIAIVGVIALAWWGSTKITEGNDQKEAQIRDLQARYDDLKVKDANRGYYEAETERFLKLYTGIMNKYGNGLDQEHIIMLLKAAEEKTGVWIKSANLAGISNLYTFGNVTSSNPARVGEKVYNSTEVGVNSALTINFEGKYAQVKDFIDYINTHHNKTLINNVNMSYSGTSEVVTGSMQLTTYGIIGGDEYEDLVIKSVAIGSENIFNSETFVSNVADGDYGQRIMTNYDLFLMLNSESSDADTVVVGTRGDIDGSKLLSTVSNIEEDVTIRITGTAGNYRVSYRIGNQTYPSDDYADGVEFVCGDTLDLLVISSSRVDSKDKAGAELQIINNSDLTLNYKVVNDDDDEPRFRLGKVTGNIIGY